jgi:hypothetical protein
VEVWSGTQSQPNTIRKRCEYAIMKHLYVEKIAYISDFPVSTDITVVKAQELLFVNNDLFERGM